MSKMRSLEKTKESIKTTISGLALMLAIGSIGAAGSYAYFSDMEEVDNSLSVTMGSFDVEIIDMQDTIITQNNQKILNKSFKIQNNGSLDQNVSLKFSNFTNNEGLLRKLNYTLDMKYGDEEVKFDTENTNQTTLTLWDLRNIVGGDLVYINNTLINLEPNKTIDVELKVNIDNGNISQEELKTLLVGQIQFNTNVESRQINAPKGGSQ